MVKLVCNSQNGNQYVNMFPKVFYNEDDCEMYSLEQQLKILEKKLAYKCYCFTIKFN